MDEAQRYLSHLQPLSGAQLSSPQPWITACLVTWYSNLCPSALSLGIHPNLHVGLHSSQAWVYLHIYMFNITTVIPTNESHLGEIQEGKSAFLQKVKTIT